MEQVRLDDESVLQALYRDYELIDVRTRLNPHETENQPLITSLLKEDPAFYFFLNCELRIAHLISQVLRDDGGELHKELERVIEDREEHRKLWDFVKETWKGEAKLKRRILQGIQNAFEKQRDRVYELLKKILWERRKTIHEPGKRKEIEGQLHLVTTIQWFHRGRAFAQKAHHLVRQMRGSGEAYIYHPLRVASRLLLASRDNLYKPSDVPDSRILVWCGHNHDVKEDTPVTLKELEEEAFLAYLQFELYRNERSVVEKEAREFARKTKAVIELDSEDNVLKKIPKEKRERAVMKRLNRARPLDIRLYAILVKISDRIDNVLTLAGMGDPEKIRRKLRSTVEWCDFILEDDLNDLGLARYLAEVTRMAYLDFEENHPDLVGSKDKKNIIDLEVSAGAADVFRNGQSFVPEIYETVSGLDDDEDDD